MNERCDKLFFIVEQTALPEVLLKTVEAKKLLENKTARSVSEAVNAVGISRSAFYKYKDNIFPFYDNVKGKTITIAFSLEDKAGHLSQILNTLASAGANILTINQNIPINGIANVTVTLETGKIESELGELFDLVEALPGVCSFKIIARG